MFGFQYELITYCSDVWQRAPPKANIAKGSCTTRGDSTPQEVLYMENRWSPKWGILNEKLLKRDRRYVAPPAAKFESKCSSFALLMW